MLEKRKPWRSRKYLDGAKGQTCILCGADDGTVVGAHYCGYGAERLGRGARLKTTDIAIADICHRCHSYLDLYIDGNSEERAVHFLIAIVLTIERRLKQGKLIVQGEEQE